MPILISCFGRTQTRMNRIVSLFSPSGDRGFGVLHGFCGWSVSGGWVVGLGGWFGWLGGWFGWLGGWFGWLGGRSVGVVGWLGGWVVWVVGSGLVGDEKFGSCMDES